MLAEGLDTTDEREASQRAAEAARTRKKTSAEAAEAYVASHQAGWRNAKHLDELPGVYAGVLLLSAIHTAINLMDLPAHYRQMILGGLVLAAVLLDTVKLSVCRNWHKKFRMKASP